jgi:hypothetical protein
MVLISILTLIIFVKVHTFYEAVGYMISAQPNKPQQEKLIAKLMDLPNNAVSFPFKALRFFFCSQRASGTR